MESFETILESLRVFWTELAAFLPRLLAALALLAVGWVVARLVRRATIRFLKLVRLDAVAERAGIEDFLVQGGVRYTAVTILAQLVYWLLLFTVLLATLNVLGLGVAAELFNRVVLYIPNVLAAVLVLLFGSLLGRFLGGALYTYLNNTGVSGARFLSTLAQWAVLVFVGFIALEQLRIGGQILVSAFQIAFGAFCLALALAFGLGGRRWAAQLLERMWGR
jgi:hypothetical protein